MSAYLLLVGAILSEVGGTLSLRMATHGSARWYAGTVLGYLAAFALLSLTLQAGLGLGAAYGIWAATGVALTAIASKALFGEPFTALMSVGVALIVAGVLLVELGAQH